MTFFRLAEQTELGRGGKQEPVYPGAAFLTFIVQWAYEHGKMPSFVYQQYLRNPTDFKLLAAFGKFKAEKEKEEIDKAKNSK